MRNMWIVMDCLSETTTSAPQSIEALRQLTF